MFYTEGGRRRRNRRLWPAAALAAAAAAGIALGVFLLSRDPSAGAAPSAASVPPAPTRAVAPTPAATPDPEPTPVPTTPAEGRVAELLAGMSLYEKVCQMMVVSPVSIAGAEGVQIAGESTRQALEKYPVGGLFYNRSNMESREQLAALLAGAAQACRIPPLLTCDEEGGRVARLAASVGATEFQPMLTYRNEGPETARQNAATIAGDMAALGFNLDLAPVADVWSNPENTVIGDRAYSDDFGQAAELIPAAVEGFHAGGVACVLKHFPGHGNTSEDSHDGSAYVHRSLEDLRSCELLPFQAGIDAGADAVMMGHLIVPAICEEPAVLCPEIVTGLLREEMGFTGVVMTDSLDMKAISDHYGNGEAAVRAVQAGVDLLLCPPDPDETIQTILAAVEDGAIPASRIDESVRRILTLKVNRGIIEA